MIKSGNEELINYKEGLARFSNHAELYTKYLRRFLEDESFQHLTQAMENQNYKDAFAQAHSLKGVSGNLSLNSLYQTLVPFVDALREGSQDIDLAVSLFPNIQAAYQDSLEAVKETLNH